MDDDTTCDCWYPTFQPGWSVVILNGAFQGMRGTVLGVDENDRVIVAVPLLRGVLPLILDPAQDHFHVEQRAAVPLHAH